MIGRLIVLGVLIAIGFVLFRVMFPPVDDTPTDTTPPENIIPPEIYPDTGEETPTDTPTEQPGEQPTEQPSNGLNINEIRTELELMKTEARQLLNNAKLLSNSQ